MADQNQEQPIVAESSEEQQLQHSVDPTNYLLYHAHAPCTTPLCCCFGSNNNSNSMKRRSPSSSATTTATATLQDRATKKLLRDQENHLTLNGFSTISFPLSHATTLNTKPCHAATAADGSFPATPFHSPEHANNAVGRACSLSPLPRSLKCFVSDPTPSPATRTFSHSSPWGHNDKGVILTNKEASNSMRLRRMKDCLREMRKWWDQVMLEEEEHEDDPQGAEGDKVLLSKDDCGGDHAEEAVSVEWAEKCLSICFKCPCGKGYQILLSGNNCYYKLV